MLIPDFSRKNKTSVLVALERSDSEFLHVEQLFLNGWIHPDKTKPHVQAIFKIIPQGHSLKVYSEYLDKVASSNPKLPTIEQLLFHGTSRWCLIAEDPKRTVPCSLPDCLLCSIIRNSFDVAKCGLRHKFRRFGCGIYTSSCSSKADDYSANGIDSSCRVVLVNRVVVGRAYQRKYNAANLSEPPSGYHSVVGSPGIDLNYPETVVYDNDAIRPAYALCYGPHPVPRHPSTFRTTLSSLFTTPLAS
ncbi:hypothetical protein C8J56DRAFT_1127056 [Mycena floridula]|nr:hypothetical protein C8J56DRAFT_1127056 [Mycena floridula]